MSAFNDATCPKCKKRFGWVGEVTDRPPCPKCGHTYPREELEADQKEMEEFEKLLIARKKARELPKTKSPTLGKNKAVSYRNKAEYVRRQKQDRDHHCHWPGCTKQVPPAMWGCRTHWYKLPQRLRDLIWNTYIPGQEKTFTPSAEYLQVADEVQEWIKENYPS